MHFVARNSGPGSSIIFNYILKSVVDGTCQVEEAREIRRACSRGGVADFKSNQGDRLLFGLEEGTIEIFLSERGFVVTWKSFPEKVSVFILDFSMKLSTDFNLIFSGQML